MDETQAAVPKAPWLALDLLPEADAGHGWGWLWTGQIHEMALDRLQFEIRQDPYRKAVRPKGFVKAIPPVPQVVFVTTPDAPRVLPAAEVPELREAMLRKEEAQLKAAFRKSWPMTLLLGGFLAILLFAGVSALLPAVLLLDPASRLAEASLALRRLRRRPDAFLHQRSREARFGWWLHVHAWPKPWTTWIMASAWAALFALQMWAGMQASVGAAALVKPRVAEEPWRLLTGPMLHGSVMHILMNGMAALSLGLLMERVAHRHLLAPVWLASALGGAALSWALLPDATSVGASGGLMGWMGFLAVLAWRRRGLLPPDFALGLFRSVLAIALLGLLAWRVIDNPGHAGGLLTGAMIALAVFRDPDGALPLEDSLPLSIAGWAGLAAFLALSVFTGWKLIAAG